MGEAVRYDGGDKHNATLVDVLGPELEWIPVCPEVEVGMGVPREAVHLVVRDEAVHMIGVESGRDWTEALRSWAAGRLAELGDVHGWVFKSRSPSCGLSVRRSDGAAGPGLFAQTVLALFPDLPCEEEERLEDPAVRAAFLAAARERVAQRAV